MYKIKGYDFEKSNEVLHDILDLLKIMDITGVLYPVLFYGENQFKSLDVKVKSGMKNSFYLTFELKSGDKTMAIHILPIEYEHMKFSFPELAYFIKIQNMGGNEFDFSFTEECINNPVINEVLTESDEFHYSVFNSCVVCTSQMTCIKLILLIQKYLNQ